MNINKIYNECCLETMSRMDDGLIDLVITSPPYDNIRKYKGFEFEFKKIAKELYRVLKDGGIVVWIVGDQTINGSESGTSFKQALYFKRIGFNIHDTMIYVKNNFMPLTHNRYDQAFEYMFILSKGRPQTFNPIKIDCMYKGKRKTLNSKNRNSGSVEDGNPMRKREGRISLKILNIKIIYGLII